MGGGENGKMVKIRGQNANKINVADYGLMKMETRAFSCL